MTALDDLLEHRRWHAGHPDAPRPPHELTHQLALEIYFAAWEPLCEECNPPTEEEFLGGVKSDDDTPPGKTYRQSAEEAIRDLPVMHEGYCPTCLIDGVAACFSYLVTAYEFGEEIAPELMFEPYRGRCRGGLPPILCTRCGKPVDLDDDEEEMA
jgi:hypothetical protein